MATHDHNRADGIAGLRHLIFVMRVVLIAGLACCIYYSTRQGMGAWYMHQDSAVGMESALRWDPRNPQISNKLGTLIHMYADGGDAGQIVSLYERAAHASPDNAQYWTDLAAAYEWAGRSTEALSAFRRAQELFPNSPDINWRLANFYARHGKSSDALESLHRVMVSGGVSRTEIFKLASASTHDSNAILDAIPPQTPALLEYLNFAIRSDDMAAAEQAWRRLLRQNAEFSLRDTFPYLDALIRSRKISELQATWALLQRRFPSEIAAHETGDNVIFNGSFEKESANGGLDWRIFPTQGAEVSEDEENVQRGAHSLRIEFDGSANPYYCHVFEYVPVHPNTRYRFSGYLRVNGITTESGPGFEIYDAYDMKKLFVSTKGLIGTSEWSRQELAFKTPPDTELLIVRIARPPSERIANQIAGTVWIDDVRLEANDEARFTAIDTKNRRPGRVEQVQSRQALEASNP